MVEEIMIFGVIIWQTVAPGGLHLYFHAGSRHFLGFKILNFNIFWGFKKNEYFWVLRFCGYFLGSSQYWTIFRGHFYAF